MIEIDGISTSSGKDRCYLKITYRVIENNCQAGRCLALQDEDLMLALFDAQLINSWDALHVYWEQDRFMVGTEGEFIKETSGNFASKYDFLRDIEEDHAFALIKNQLFSL